MDHRRDRRAARRGQGLNAATRRLSLTLAGIVGNSTARETRAAVRSLPRRWARRVPGGAHISEYDPLGDAVLADPYPWYARLLEEAPLHYARRRRLFVVPRYDDVRAATHAHEALSSAESVTPARSALPMMIAMDRPGHTRLRRLVAKHFTRDALEAQRPAIEAIAREYLDRLPFDQGTDAVSGLAGPVPVEVIAELLGVPREDRAPFRRWSDQIVEGFSVSSVVEGARTVRSVANALLPLHAYFVRAFDERRGAPRDDLLGHLTASCEAGELTPEELFWFAVLLLVAGNETTTNLIGTMLLTLAERPDVYARLREEPELLPAAIEESLRCAAPIQGFCRTALTDYDVDEGMRIPAGGRVLLLFGAANRDPRRYPDPGDYRLDRNPSDHLGFGSGIHFCLGAHLARIEAAVVFGHLLERVRSIELAGEPVWTRNPSLRGPAALPVRLTPG